jgi:hypothetical protein
MKRGIWWACCLASGSAFAQEGVHWQYIAPPECPSEQQFRDLVRARLLADPRAGNSAADKSADSPVSVEVRLEPSQHRATLLLKERDASPVERVVDGDSCEELVSGLALITALAFGAAREPTKPTATTEPSQPIAPIPTSGRPPPLEPKPAAESTTASHRDQTRSNASTLGPLAIEVGAGGWANTWSAPNGELGLDLFVRMAPQPGRGWSLRAAALYGFRTSYVGDRAADFTFIGGRADGCPLAHSFRPWLSAEACLGLELGALRGRGRDSSALLEEASDTVFSATALITGRIRTHFSERFFLEAQGDLGLPLVRHEFVFEEPTQRIFQIPVIGFSARLGLGVQFP